MEKIAQGEGYLKTAGFPTVRLRLHGDVARIEIPQADFQLFLEKREEITEKFIENGFLYITLDVEGFRSGSMDEKK